MWACAVASSLMGPDVSSAESLWVLSLECEEGLLEEIVYLKRLHRMNGKKRVDIERLTMGC